MVHLSSSQFSSHSLNATDVLDVTSLASPPTSVGIGRVVVEELHRKTHLNYHNLQVLLEIVNRGSSTMIALSSSDSGKRNIW